MKAAEPPRALWTNWLLATAIGVTAFGLALVVAPDLALQGFSLLIYSDADRIASFGQEAARYISLAHAVLGGVMVGWGVALIIVVRTLFAVGHRAGWNIVALSATTWFVPDTAYSLASGYWQNALLNLAFLVLFAVPLIATSKVFRGSVA